MAVKAAKAKTENVKYLGKDGVGREYALRGGHVFTYTRTRDLQKSGLQYLGGHNQVLYDSKNDGHMVKDSKGVYQKTETKNPRKAA